MNYIGSKKSLLELIKNSIDSVVKEKNYKFSDLFAGTGIVGRFFKGLGHDVISNDLQYYSFVMNKNFLENNSHLLFNGLVKEMPSLKKTSDADKNTVVLTNLNSLDGVKGFVYENYSVGGTKGKEFERMYFSDENAMKCDAIRQKIESWKKSKKITEGEYYFLLASLLESVDKVANTTSVYGAFLKKLKKSALSSLTLKPSEFTFSNTKSQVFNKDVNVLISETKHDVVYLDPPYNERQYSANYHVLETIAKYDNPVIKGKTGMRDYSSQKSEYCRKNAVKKAFSDLISKIDAKYVFVSYNCEGLLTLEDIKEVMSSRGKYGVFSKEYRRFKADKTEARNHKQDSVTEYLHYVIVKNKPKQ